MTRNLDLRHYEAMHVVDKNRHDAVELRLQDGRLFFVRRLDLGPTAVAPDQTAMTMLFRQGTVILYGAGLAELARAISRWSVEWVQAFDAMRFDRPADRRELFVERIEVWLRGGDEEDATRPTRSGADAAGNATH